MPFQEFNEQAVHIAIDAFLGANESQGDLLAAEGVAVELALPEVEPGRVVAPAENREVEFVDELGVVVGAGKFGRQQEIEKHRCFIGAVLQEADVEAETAWIRTAA